MHRHYDRFVYNMIDEPTIILRPSFLSDTSSPLFLNPDELSESALAVVAAQPRFRFGRMFDKLKADKPSEYSDEELKARIEALAELGRAMSAGAQGGNASDQNDSDIPSGYTYLGQSLAHEISFDKRELSLSIVDLGDEEQARSPTIDLDGLYGKGPHEEGRKMYENARLKVDETAASDDFNVTLPNDLPREKEDEQKLHQAIIGDPRNDENLIVAQTHLALIKFHNKVVGELEKAGHTAEGLFEAAREKVVKHFQYIILYDYLPQIIDESVLKRVLDNGPQFFSIEKTEDLFMPVEFSVAAFRLGHSMVRESYEWNRFHNSKRNVKVPIIELFEFTGFSGTLGNNNSSQAPKLNIPSDWVIDWRRFYDFTGVRDDAKALSHNRAKKIDTVFNFQLETVRGYPHNVAEAYRPITVRNLIRGFALGLPSGQAVAEAIGEPKISRETLLDVPYRDLMVNHGFDEETPLWYYILKEAELKGGKRLGNIGSCIIAETLVGIIKNSPVSILDGEKWQPEFGKRAPEHFGMADMLEFAEVVDPIGQHLASHGKK